MSSSNIYTRRVLAGEFQVVCPWLLRELIRLDLWDDNMKNRIIAHNGSVQYIPEIPDDVKAIYKTVWEISQKKVLDLAADRGAFICQSQSLNVHLQAPTVGQLTSMHFYGWKRGLKTGMYYLRTRPAAQAIQFTLDHNLVKETRKVQQGKQGASKVETGKTSEKEKEAVEKTAEPAVASVGVVVNSETGLATPMSESNSSPVEAADAATASSRSSPGPATPAATDAVVDISALKGLDEKTLEAAAKDPEFAAALLKAQERKFEEEKLMCSLENKEACLMCSA